MTVPSLPASVSAGTSVSSARANAVRSLFQWFRDDLPVLQVRNSGAQSINASTDTDIDFSATPLINNGTFTDTATSNDGWKVPDDGVYLFFIWTEFASIGSENGYRACSPTVNGSVIGGSRTRVVPVVGSVTGWLSPGIQVVNTGDELGAIVRQTDSGGAINLDAMMIAVWLAAL